MEGTQGQAPRGRRRAEETQRLLLEVAEALFAEKGFAATRLEDVAERIGVRRASLTYYYRDKAELYDAVLQELMTDMREGMRAALRMGPALPDRVEATVEAWVQYMGRRPTAARILLREVADAVPERISALHSYGDGVLLDWCALVREGQKAGLFHDIDPIHLATALIGATIFFFSATPILAPDWPFDPTSPQQLATYRSEMLRITQRLLGTRGPKLLRSKGEPK